MNKQSSNSDNVSLFDYDKVYSVLDSLTLKQIYYVMDILPNIFSRKFFDDYCSSNYSDRFFNYASVISSLHDNLHFLSASELTRLRLYIDRLVFKSCLKSDDDFINQLFDDVSPSKKNKYEKSKKNR